VNPLPFATLSLSRVLLLHSRYTIEATRKYAITQRKKNKTDLEQTSTSQTFRNPSRYLFRFSSLDKGSIKIKDQEVYKPTDNSNIQEQSQITNSLDILSTR